MAIRVKCRSCDQTLKAEERHAGRTVRCPSCREPVEIPALATAPLEEETLDPFADLAAPPFAVAPPAPGPPTAPRRQRHPEPVVEPAAPPPVVDDDEIGDWLSEGAADEEADDFDEVAALPSQSPNWDGVAETFDVAETNSMSAVDTDALPPKVRKKKKKVMVKGPEDERKRSASPRLARERSVLRGRPQLLWVLAACLLPLAISVVWAEPGVDARIELSVLENPGLEERISNLPESSEDPLGTLLAVFPDHKIHGALFSRDSWWHLGLAALSSLGFLGLILAMWPDEEVSPGYLIGMGVFTGTVGILLLLGFQYVAEFTQQVRFRGFGIGILGIVRFFLWIVHFIGYSYRCAFDPEIGFAASFFGFTFGVGLCEELCKAAPIVMYLRGARQQTWRGATVVGFASGIGFGVSEAISYSADMYNGIATPMLYAVRFLSCVALHTLWAGIVGLLMFRDQSHLFDAEWDDVLWFVVRYLGIAMVLHGLYDALLKFDYEFGALTVAAGSFAWLMWLVTRQEKEELVPA